MARETNILQFHVNSLKALKESSEPQVKSNDQLDRLVIWWYFIEWITDLLIDELIFDRKPENCYVSTWHVSENNTLNKGGS